MCSVRPTRLISRHSPGLEDSVKPGRTGEDLLFQVLLDWGLELTMPISVEKVEGHEVLRCRGRRTHCLLRHGGQP